MSSIGSTSPSKGSSRFGVNVNPVKVEHDSSNLNSGINAESNGTDDVRPLLSDPEDYLEEDESLDMNLENGRQKIWLVKLPRYLAEKWSNTKELNGKRLGTVKIKSGGASSQREKSNNQLQVKLVLNKELRMQEIPQEYDINMFNTQVLNSYVFSEENLNKFKQEFTELKEIPNQPVLEEEEVITRSNPYYNRGYGDYIQDEKESTTAFVKTIPKKTALVGQICHDCQITPSKIDSKYDQTVKKRRIMPSAKEKAKVTLLDEIPGVIQSNAGPSIRGQGSSIFLRTNNKAKNLEGRAIRMPKKDLLDLLFRLFDEYEYWSMKGLKERTRQPESYLKESLESIANLIKRGPYTSKYHLKPEYRKLRDAERASRLGLDISNINDNKDDNEDNEDGMESII